MRIKQYFDVQRTTKQTLFVVYPRFASSRVAFEDSVVQSCMANYVASNPIGVLLKTTNMYLAQSLLRFSEEILIVVSLANESY